jgi:two-component system sensor histidine kinase GlrK
MNQLPRPLYFPRFPLFGKIVAGFVLIIIFMIGSSIVVLLQLKPLFLLGQTEFHTVQLSQYLEKLLDAENESVRKCFTTRDPADIQTRYLITQQFHSVVDSLYQITDRNEVRSLIQAMLARHKRYEEFVQNQIDLLKKNPSHHALAALREKGAAIDSLRVQVHSINYTYLPTLTKALRFLGQKTTTAMSGAYITLALALVIAIAVAVMLAKTITRPIQALKAGTEKVGEGLFETVTVTTNDEVADLTRAFNLMSDKLKQLDEMRMQLMSEISHEMRTPLQVIKAGCYAIIHTKDGPVLTQRQNDAVGMIHQATNRINQFVNSFLDVAKMEAGLMKFQFEETNLNEMLSPLVQEAQLIAQTRQIKVEFNAEKVLLLSLDKERMSQVFSNLLSNALKYTPNEGRITVSVIKQINCDGLKKHSNGCIKIDVQDSGVGIPESDIEKLFSKFYQAKNTPFVNEKGSGLGLALVKHVSEAHGGKVAVTSKVGVGSTFSVILPA